MWRAVEEGVLGVTTTMALKPFPLDGAPSPWAPTVLDDAQSWMFSEDSYATASKQTTTGSRRF